MDNLYLLVKQQFPEFVQSDYPAFVAFVQEYYKWMEQQGVGKIEDVVDIDDTPARFVQYFRKQLDVHGVFNSSSTFDTRYLKNIKQIYDSKGSEQCLVNILRLVHEVDVSVRYPSEQILRASDGRWQQQSFITVETLSGDIPSSIGSFQIAYDYENVLVVVDNFTVINSNTIRLYYTSYKGVALTLGQIIAVYESDVAVYVGRIVESPSTIEIINGGLDWQLGQVVRIPGTTNDTIARVSAITGTGTIQRVEILEYGYSHADNETIIISPYPYKPIGSTYDVTVEITSISPLKRQYTLDVYDYMDGATDHVVGISSGVNVESYFLEEYVEADYVGYIVFDNFTTPSPYVEGDVTDITIEQWLASRATLALRPDVNVKTRGRWVDHRGQISNQDIRLQDNFYYQQFSYEIEAPVSISKYADLIADFHPAGTKKFTSYALGGVFEIQPTAVTSFPFITQDLFDNAQPTDTNNKLIEKLPIDAVTAIDFDKEILAKRVTETLTISDADTETVTKRLTETVLTSDVDTEVVEKRINDTITLSEIVSKPYNKYTSDSVTVSSPDTASLEVIEYNTEGYFAENYVMINKNLTLGA